LNNKIQNPVQIIYKLTYLIFPYWCFEMASMNPNRAPKDSSKKGMPKAIAKIMLK